MKIKIGKFIFHRIRNSVGGKFQSRYGLAQKYFFSCLLWCDSYKYIKEISEYRNDLLFNFIKRIVNRHFLEKITVQNTCKLSNQHLSNVHGIVKHHAIRLGSVNVQFWGYIRLEFKKIFHFFLIFKQIFFKKKISLL